jgi:hypothetical protein
MTEEQAVTYERAEEADVSVYLDNVAGETVSVFVIDKPLY